jgi:hypothetical protein
LTGTPSADGTTIAGRSEKAEDVGARRSDFDLIYGASAEPDCFGRRSAAVS